MARLGQVPTMPTDSEYEALDNRHARYGYDEEAEKMYNALRKKEEDFARFIEMKKKEEE
tara:strand:+ start:458 stop:634 length:177 start_codon:yes stop_codon:yes gene_type:complete